LQGTVVRRDYGLGSGWQGLDNPALKTWTSIAVMGEHWTKLPMISTWDDICWIWPKRASSTSIVASMFRLAVISFHLVQQSDRNVACLVTVICVVECRLRGQGGMIKRSATLWSRYSHCLFLGFIGCVAQSQKFRTRRLRFGLNPERDYCYHCEAQRSYQRHRISSQALGPQQHRRNVVPSSTADIRPHRLGTLRIKGEPQRLITPPLKNRMKCGMSHGRGSLSGSPKKSSTQPPPGHHHETATAGAR